MKRNIFLIAIRKESKGIPGKNVKPLNGKPLVFWVIDSILKSGASDEVWVATDCTEAEILIHNRYGTTVGVFRRSSASAGDKTPIMHVINEFLDFKSLQDETLLVLAQAIVPFTSPETFSNLITIASTCDADSFIACSRLRKFLWSESGKPLSYSIEAKPMRQQYHGPLFETGAFYASTIGAIRQSGQLLSGKILPIETAFEETLDIDYPEDWILAEYIASQHSLQ